MFLMGSHDSAANKCPDSVSPIEWMWAKTQRLDLVEQYNCGTRLFDLRYSFDFKLNDIIISHTFPTKYTLKSAFLELLSACTTMDNSNNSKTLSKTIIVRLKRDNAHQEQWPDGQTLQLCFDKIYFGEQPVSNFFVSKKKPDNLILIYSDNNSLVQDGLSKEYIHGQQFDTVETWQYNTLDDAVTAIEHPKFLNNGLQKIIFLDFSSYIPPIIAFEMLYSRVKQKIDLFIRSNVIQGLVVNNVKHSF